MDDIDPELEEIVKRYTASKKIYDACEHNWVLDEDMARDFLLKFEVCTGCGWAQML